MSTIQPSKKQRGYIDLDGLFMTCMIIAIIVGVAVWEFLKWLWPFVKALIHSATA